MGASFTSGRVNIIVAVLLASTMIIGVITGLLVFQLDAFLGGSPQTNVALTVTEDGENIHVQVHEMGNFSYLEIELGNYSSEIHTIGEITIERTGGANTLKVYAVREDGSRKSVYQKLLATETPTQTATRTTTETES